MNSLMGNNQAMSNAKQKAESTGVFSLHPSPAPRLCVNSSSPVGVAKHRLILYWNTAVLLLPSTCSSADRPSTRLEDCRIYTSFYSLLGVLQRLLIGRLPYLYFLLLALPRIPALLVANTAANTSTKPVGTRATPAVAHSARTALEMRENARPANWNARWTRTTQSQLNW
jgi:hypothetical protein